MGWYTDDGSDESYDHEGYVRGVVRDGFGWRDLGIDDVRDDVRLMQVQVCCDCGWRTRRYTAPVGSYWSPCIVIFPDEGFEDAAMELWQAHRDNLGTTSDLWELGHEKRRESWGREVRP